MPSAQTVRISNMSRPYAATAASIAAFTVLAAAPAFADSAYVTQAAVGGSAQIQMIGPTHNPQTAVTHARSISVPTSTPEMAAARGSGHMAQTFQIGNHNHVAHLQVGTGNQSTAGIIGNLNQVGVLQAGNNLRSNVVLLGTQGLNVGVIQPPGSPPVSMLIARLPNGGLLIKR
ncbi:hypothetical protein GU700_00110 [Methylobacterium sp. NI91]|nr:MULTISPECIES: hypothetical protein [unclassified Methylobacterium]QIJ73154.1 hypothetical protein CLZ_00110 [Methylobacterium sp. CLZ]QIJ78059.1 hypothetical protein GU700_00110 [Methylobacterium sp. NI91]